MENFFPDTKTYVAFLRKSPDERAKIAEAIHSEYGEEVFSQFLAELNEKKVNAEKNTFSLDRRRQWLDIEAAVQRAYPNYEPKGPPPIPSGINTEDVLKGMIPTDLLRSQALAASESFLAGANPIPPIGAFFEKPGETLKNLAKGLAGLPYNAFIKPGGQAVGDLGALLEASGVLPPGTAPERTNQASEEAVRGPAGVLPALVTARATMGPSTPPSPSAGLLRQPATTALSKIAKKVTPQAIPIRIQQAADRIRASVGTNYMAFGGDDVIAIALGGLIAGEVKGTAVGYALNILRQHPATKGLAANTLEKLAKGISTEATLLKNASRTIPKSKLDLQAEKALQTQADKTYKEASKAFEKFDKEKSRSFKEAQDKLSYEESVRVQNAQAQTNAGEFDSWGYTKPPPPPLELDARVQQFLEETRKEAADRALLDSKLKNPTFEENPLPPQGPLTGEEALLGESLEKVGFNAPDVPATPYAWAKDVSEGLPDDYIPKNQPFGKTREGTTIMEEAAPNLPPSTLQPPLPARATIPTPLTPAASAELVEQLKKTGHSSKVSAKALPASKVETSIKNLYKEGLKILEGKLQGVVPEQYGTNLRENLMIATSRNAKAISKANSIKWLKTNLGDDWGDLGKYTGGK